MDISKRNLLLSYFRLPVLLIALAVSFFTVHAQQIKVGVFNVDVTPPVGSPVAYATTRSIMDPLSARGIIILSEDKPIILCAVDWIGIANEGLELWQKELAAAAHTTTDRVSIHSLHQHD